MDIHFIHALSLTCHSLGYFGQWRVLSRDMYVQLVYTHSYYLIKWYLTTISKLQNLPVANKSSMYSALSLSLSRMLHLKNIVAYSSLTIRNSSELPNCSLDQELGPRSCKSMPTCALSGNYQLPLHAHLQYFPSKEQ